MDNLFDKITFESRNGNHSTYKVWDSGAARIISEFTMAERRQNLMSGDGYNTIYAKLSRWYEDFKPIVFSGSYTDLENKPTIPNVYNGTLEIKRNGVSVQTFSANSALNVIADIEVPEIDDSTSSATTLYSSQRIDQLIQELGPNIINNNDDNYEIDADTINQITEQVLQRIEVPPAEVDYTAIYSYIDSHMPTVGNGKLTVTVNGVKSIAQVSNGVPALLPDASNFFSANQTEDVELNLDIPQPIELIDNTTYSDNRTWSSSKIRSEILANGSLRMVVLAAGTSHTDIIGEANTIYFERITNADLENQYEEWVWIGDAWENIGKQVIDLSDYAHHNEIKDSTINIIQNGVVLGSFTLNQSSNFDITIPTPLIGDGTITITQGFDTETVVEEGETVTREVPHVVGTFTVNQDGNTTIDIPKPDEQIQSDWNQTDENAKDFIKNKPTIPEAQVNADWNSESGKSQILNKPTDLVHTSDIEGLLKNDGTVYTGKYLEQVQDLDNFQASEGKIVQYIGETNSKYTNSFNYRKVGTRKIIQPGTRYIEINDSTGELLKVGVPNGRYYNIDEYEKIIWHTRCLGSPTIGEIPVKSNEMGFNEVTNIGSYAIVNNKFLKITSVRNLNDNGYLKTGNTYGSGRNSIIGFEDGTEIEISNLSNGDESPISQNYLNVYENQNGIRIYQRYGYNSYVLTTEDWGDAKRAISFSTFIRGNTTEEVIIDTSEWQQCIPPEEDTSHYVLDSDIGWIEH